MFIEKKLSGTVGLQTRIQIVYYFILSNKMLLSYNFIFLLHHYHYAINIDLLQI